jgi:hypothetical protein
MFATMVTRRDTMLEGLIYLTDDLAEAQQIGRLMLQQNKGVFSRTWVKGLTIEASQVNEWWANIAYHDGVEGVPCPLVPKTFARTYWCYFQRAELDKVRR